MTERDKQIWKARFKVAGMVLVGSVLLVLVMYVLGTALEGTVATVNSSKTSPSSTVPQAMDKIATALKWIALAIALQLTRK